MRKRLQNLLSGISAGAWDLRDIFAAKPFKEQQLLCNIEGGEYPIFDIHAYLGIFCAFCASFGESILLVNTETMICGTQCFGWYCVAERLRFVLLIL